MEVANYANCHFELLCVDLSESNMWSNTVNFTWKKSKYGQDKHISLAFVLKKFEVKTLPNCMWPYIFQRWKNAIFSRKLTIKIYFLCTANNKNSL